MIKTDEATKPPLSAWQERAAEHRKLTGAARDRYNRHYMLSGLLVHGAAAERAFAEAVELAKQLRAEDSLDSQFSVFPRAPMPVEQRARRERRIVPGDYVAVHADTMVGLAAALACIEAERHDAVAAHAELMADFHSAIERAVEHRLAALAKVAP